MFREINSQRFLYISLIVIFAIALFLRLYKLSSYPVGFHIDEANLGYNAYSLLLTGKDDSGKPFPLYTSMFDDNNPTGYHYLAIPSVKLFGLNEFATRFPAAFFGSLTIFAMYFFSQVLFGSRKISLTASFFLAIAPWHINFSRGSAETLVALFFVLLGFAFVIRGITQSRSTRSFIIGAILLAASFFIYPTPRIFVPLLLFCLMGIGLWQQKKIVFSKNLRQLLLVFFALCAIVIFLVKGVLGGTGRFQQVSIFNFPETQLVMNEQIREDGVAGTGIFETRLFHNKLTNYTLTFFSNYFEYFSGSYLFIKGGLPLLTVIPNMGLVYIVLLPFILIGLVLLSIEKNRLNKIVLFWFFLGPVTAAITFDDAPNVRRAILMLPMIELLAAYGFIHASQKLSYNLRYIVMAIFLLFLVGNVSYFLHQYFVHTKTHQTWYRNNGQRELMRLVNESYESVDKIVITKATGGIYPIVLFYAKYDPQAYQKEGSPKDKEYTGFGKFFFVPQACPMYDRDGRFPKEEKIIYINKGDCKDSILYKLHDVYKEDGARAFRIAYD